MPRCINGEDPYAFLWSNGATTQTISNLDFAPSTSLQTFWTMEKYNGCTGSPYNSFTLSEGIVPNKHYDISFYETREGGQMLPNDLYNVQADATGKLIISLSTPIACDTANADFAFIASRVSSGNRFAPTDSTETIALEFNVNPNPNNGFFDLYIPDEPAKSKLILSIYDMTGRKIRTLQIYNTHTHLDFNNLVSGVYYLILKNDKVIGQQKVIIQK